MFHVPWCLGLLHLAMNGFQVQETLTQIVHVGTYPPETERPVASFKKISLFICVKSENMLSHVATSLANLSRNMAIINLLPCCLDSPRCSFIHWGRFFNQQIHRHLCLSRMGSQQKHKKNGQEWQYSQGGYLNSKPLNINTSGFHGKSLQIRLIAVDAEKQVGTHLSTT